MFQAKKIDLSKYDILVENYHGKIKPDIRLISKSYPEKQLLIEVAVTHKISSSKQEFIEANNLALVEINLSSFYRKKEPLLVEEVRKIIIDNPYKSTWKHITRKEELLHKRKDEIMVVIEEKLRSIKKIYLNLVEEYFENTDHALRDLNDEDLLWDTAAVIEEIEEDSFRHKAGSEIKISTNEKLLKHFISIYKGGETYKIILENKKRKQREIEEWRKKFRENK